MVGRAFERNPGSLQTAQRIGQRGTRRIKDGQMVEPGGPRGRRISAQALPRIETDMVVITAGGDEGRLRPEALHEFETEHAAVEIERALQVGDLQVNVSNAERGID